MNKSPETAGPSKKPRDLRSPTDLDVVLDTFQEIVTQYKYVYDVNSSNHSSVFLVNRSQTLRYLIVVLHRQNITSDAVKRSIDAVSRSFEEQLSEIVRLIYASFHRN